MWHIVDDRELTRVEGSEPPTFLILLSCYDGVTFLPQLLDSILDQDYRHYSILIRDDASNDGTLALLREYAGRSAGRMTLVLSGSEPRLGPRESFRRLLEHALEGQYAADFFLFADQDDVWLSHKLSAFASRIREEDLAASYPVLLHSDLCVVGPDLELVHSSYLRYQGLDARANRPGDLTLVNTVTGCAMALSRSLAKRCVDMPAEAVMHDWWAALQASIHGRIIYMDEALVLYRQHGANALGAHRYEPRGLLARLHGVRQGGARDEYLTAVARQARVLMRHSSVQSLPWTDRWQLRLVAGMDHNGPIGRLWRLNVHRALARLRRTHRPAP